MCEHDMYMYISFYWCTRKSCTILLANIWEHLCSVMISLGIHVAGAKPSVELRRSLFGHIVFSFLDTQHSMPQNTSDDTDLQVGGWKRSAALSKCGGSVVMYVVITYL